MGHKRALRVGWISVALLIGMLLGLGTATVKVPGEESLPGMRQVQELMEANRLEKSQEGMAMSQVLSVDYRMADRSLVVREQVDFFLTPALLVQEAISDDVVLTYPEE